MPASCEIALGALSERLRVAVSVATASGHSRQWCPHRRTRPKAPARSAFEKELRSPDC